VISEEQFGFLQKRQIHGGVSLTQEALHSIKTLKQSATILKIDLSKSYDRVNWNFLHLALRKMGLHLPMTNWITGCINSPSFAVLINGSP
jgi:hypothetical protein